MDIMLRNQSNHFRHNNHEAGAESFLTFLNPLSELPLIRHVIVSSSIGIDYSCQNSHDVDYFSETEVAWRSYADLNATLNKPASGNMEDVDSNSLVLTYSIIRRVDIIGSSIVRMQDS